MLSSVVRLQARVPAGLLASTAAAVSTRRLPSPFCPGSVTHGQSLTATSMGCLALPARSLSSALPRVVGPITSGLQVQRMATPLAARPVVDRSLRVSFRGFSTSTWRAARPQPHALSGLRGVVAGTSGRVHGGLSTFAETLNSPVSVLRAKVTEDPALHKSLLASLNQAQALAKKNLNPALFAALEWPTTMDEYYRYLDGFERYIPQQSGDPAWQDPATGQAQEVYDRLCHFYWLIDQNVRVDDTCTVAQDDQWFSNWLIVYARAWGTFLNTPNSFNRDVLDSFRKYSPKYEVENSMIEDEFRPGELRPNSPSGWLTFNQFFARELNPGLRPIDSPTDNSVVVSPADCTYKAQYGIDSQSRIPPVVMKKTHEFASIPDLLQGSQFADSFADGVFSHYFLGPYSYHRFHTPVAGKVVECYPVFGKVYLEVNITNGQFDAPDSAQGGYEFTQARGVISIDTTDSPYGNVGIVTIVPIGMCQVSSVNMTAQVNSQVLKGDEFGYFLFGGSDIIVLYQAGVKADVLTDTKYLHYGNKVANVQPLVKSSSWC